MGKPIKIALIGLCVFMLSVLTACGQMACDVCGRNHHADFVRGVNGAPSHNAFFEVFSADPYSNEFLRVYVASCWSGSVAPEFRLSFIAGYDISEMYQAISDAESNVPFRIAFDGEAITLTTDIVGLEEVVITQSERQSGVGFAYIMKRGNDNAGQFVGTNEKLDYLIFLELLVANGFSFEEMEREEWDVGFLSVLPKRIYIGDEQITIYEYDSNQEMVIDSEFVSRSGFSIDNRNTGQFISVSWLSNPYWFKRDYIIVLYVGTNQRIIEFLHASLELFAGGVYQ